MLACFFHRAKWQGGMLWAGALALAMILGAGRLAAMAAAPPHSLGGGLRPPTKEEKAWAAKNVRTIRSRADLSGQARRLDTFLPARVVNVEYLPAVDAQVFGSCTSWATTYYYKTWQEAKEHGWSRPDWTVNPERVASPAFTFNLNNGGDPWGGTSFEGTLQILLDQGTCMCDQWQPNEDPRIFPQPEQYYAAFAQRAQSLAWIDTTSPAGLDALKAHLASGDLMVFGMNIYENFHAYPASGDGINSEVYFANRGALSIAPGALVASHALCAIGYDDTKAWTDDQGGAHTGAVLVVNSWGTGWGAQVPEAGTAGFIWLSYDYFMANAWGCYIMEDRIGYTPTLVGTFHLTHGRAAEVSVQLLGGDRYEPDWTMNAMPRSLGARGVDATFAFDATDYASTDNNCWWLKISDYYSAQPDFQPAATGEISSFQIKRLDGKIWSSPDAPVQTVESNLVNAYTWLNIGLVQQREDLFPQATPLYGHAWGDLDGDGDQDVLFINVTASDVRVWAYRNDGDWQFAAVDPGLPAQLGGMALGDYNGDGLPDLAYNGWDVDTSAYVTRIFRNQGDCMFADSGIVLPGSAQQLDWVDVNNDGRLDLFLHESDGLQSLGRKVYVNQTDGTFADSGMALPPTDVYGWADYDRDGWVDLAITGTTSYLGTFTELYHNDSGTLTKQAFYDLRPASALAWGDANGDGWLDLALSIAATPPATHEGELWLGKGGGAFELKFTFGGVAGGGMAWGDMDNDGVADLCAWGSLGGSLLGQRATMRVYRNLGEGALQNEGYNLWELYGGSDAYTYADLLDVDGDGDLDLCTCGPGGTTYPQPRQLRIYENFTAQSEGLARPNTPPAVPTDLIAAQSGGAGGPVTLSWSAGADAQTPADGLLYDVRLGSNPGWGDLLAPDFSAPLQGNRLGMTLSSSQLGLTLVQPPATAFYWSVRTIDPAQGCSPWSGAQLFVPAGATTPADVNADGSVDVADLVRTVLMADGQAEVDLTRADRNLDGGVDLIDVEHMQATLLASAGPDPRLLAQREVGPQGGTIATGSIAVTIPQGAFEATQRLTIERRENDAQWSAGEPLSGQYRLSGLPAEFSQPVTVRLKTQRSASAQVMMAVGQVQQPSSSLAERRTWSLETAGDLGGGEYSFEIEPNLTAEPTARVGKSNSKTAPARCNAGTQYTLTIDLELTEDYAVWANNHFSITFPTALDFGHITSLGTDLEDAYQMLEGTGGGAFNLAGRSKWPVKVTVHKMASNGIYGEFVASKWGDNYGWMEINTDNIADHAAVRVTAMHEFFHLVQNLYDPRTGFMKAVGYPLPDYFWLKEAASVWSEGLVAPSPYLSTLANENLLAPFNGLQAGANASKKAAQDHGYGLSSLMAYLAARQGGPDVVRKIFESVKTGSSAVQAIMSNGPTLTDFNWWPEYLLALVKGEIYGFSTGDMATASSGREFKIETADAIEKQQFYAGSLPDLSGRLHMSYPLYSGLSSTQRLACRLKKDEGSNQQLWVLKAKAGEATALLGEGVEANGAWKFEVENLQQLQSETGWRLLELVTNKKFDNPAGGASDYELIVAVVDEGTRALPPKTVTAKVQGYSLMTMNVSGSLQGRGWAEWTTLDLGMMNYVIINMPALPPINFKLTCTATPTNSSVTLPAESNGDYEVWSVPGGIRYYKFEFFNGPVGPASVTYDSDTGVFNFALTRDDLQCGGNIYAVFDVVCKRYNSQGQLISQYSIANMDCPIYGLAMNP